MSDSDRRSSLPFEPKSKKKKVEKKPPITPAKAKQKPGKGRVDNSIPEVVSRRMVKRMALFSGVPTGLGMFSFVGFYVVVSQGWLEIPTYVVLAVSLLLFGLGVFGLSYGIFSTSWEDEPGSWWGWSEFRLNLGRTLSAWRSARTEARPGSEN